MKMMLAAVAGLSILLCLSASASEITKYEKAFCATKTQGGYGQQALMDSGNRLSFTNRGGLFGGGTCWWHSRFTRKALYLAIFRPDLPRPATSKEAKKIIKDIRMGRITIVPGYKNLRQFSLDFGAEIQDRLDKWQIGDGFLRQQWTVGMWGGSKTSAKKLKQRMDDLYVEVAQKKNVTYQMLQMPGVVAHAWLVVGMEKTSSGYNLTVIDSNYRSPTTFRYKNGDKNLNYSYFGRFVPITGKKPELRKIKKTLKKYCDKIAE